MPYKLQDVIDLKQFQSLLERLSGIYPFPSAIIDNDGVVLVATGWQDICTQFHRQNVACEKACIKSDQYIVDHIAEANPAVSYRCPHGLIDNAMPIIIDGQHLGSFFTGQFFMEEPDLDFFRAQARQYGFDEDAYLEAVSRVPIWNRDQLDNYLSFIQEMIGVLSSVGLRNLQSLKVTRALRESEYFFKESQRAAFIGSYKTDFIAGTWESSEVLDQIFGIDQDFARTIANWVTLVHPNDRDMMDRYLREEVIAQGRPFNKEYRILRKSDGAVRWLNGLGEVHLDPEGRAVSMIGTIQDITERKQAEEALRESEYRWKFAVEGSGSGLWDWNVPEGTVFFSNRWKEMLGFEGDEIRDDVEEWSQRIHPDDLAPTMVELEAHLSGEKPFYSVEQRLRCKDGSWKWIHDRGVVVSRDDAGKPLRMIGSHTDVTDRKEAEEALRKNEARYRTLVEGVPGIVYSFSSLRGGFYYSSRTLEIIGYSPEQLYAKPMLWRDSIHPDDLPLVEQSIRGALDGRGFSIEYRILDARGNWRWLEDRSTGCKVEGDEIIIEGFVLDITERKQAEQEQVRLMAAIEQVAETVVITDSTGAIQYVNPFFERTTGYTWEEVIQQNPRILGSGKHDSNFYKEMWDTLARGEVWSGRIINKKKDGSLFTEEATISPVRNSMGKIVNYVAVKRDITHEIALTEQLRQSQKMEAVGQLAGGIAHDFNNFLQVIFGYGEIAMKEVGVDSLARASLEEIMTAAERARALVSQLLAFSRRQVLEIKDVDLNDSVAAVVKMMDRVIGENIALQCVPGHSLWNVRADPGQIDQLLLNLLVNARDAIAESGTITIQTENVRIGEAYCNEHPQARPGCYVLLSVTDTGCGMDQATLGRVFEPFFTTKELGKGTGLGLATVYGVVKQHQGFIDVCSETGKGTAFKIYLPQADRPTAVVASKPEDVIDGGTETILVAEDEEALLYLMKAFLEQAGYTVLTARDGEEALHLFERHGDAIDLALLDVLMPVLPGKTVYNRIRETRPDLPFLFASGYSMNALHTDLVLDEGLNLLQKPFRRADLLRKVRVVLDEHGAAPDVKGSQALKEPGRPS